MQNSEGTFGQYNMCPGTKKLSGALAGTLSKTKVIKIVLYFTSFNHKLFTVNL